MRVPIENKGQNTLFIGGMMIPGGETAHFEEDDLPPEYRRAAEPLAEAALDPLGDLLEGNVHEVVDGLSVLSDDFLARLEVLEGEGKKRKGVIEAIASERLARAEAAASGPAVDVEL